MVEQEIQRLQQALCSTSNETLWVSNGIQLS